MPVPGVAAVTGDTARTPGTGRTGRRPGHQDTRETILDAARGAFAERGFSGASMRAIARRAEVDPALIHHYFGSKEQLFVASVALPVNPRQVIERVAAGPVDTLGPRLTTAVLGVWESPAGPALVTALRAAIADPATTHAVQEFLSTQVVARVLDIAGCPPDEYELRGSLIASQVLGAMLGRHVLRIEPLASQSFEPLVAEIGRTIQHYLTGPLGP